MKDQKGFGIVGILLIVGTLAVVGLVGYVVYSRVVSRESATLDKETSQNTKPKSTENKSNEDYLDIKEWGVRFKLSDKTKGTYYTYDETNGVEVFNKDFDQMKNAEGASCEGVNVGRIARLTKEEYSQYGGEISTDNNQVLLDPYHYTYSSGKQQAVGCMVLDSKTQENFEVSLETSIDEKIVLANEEYIKLLKEQFLNLESNAKTAPASQSN